MKIPASRSYAWLVYVILWGMVWGYPVSTALVVAVRVGSAFSWDGVLHSWAGILPFFLLFLIHRLPVRCLFMHHRVQVYVLSVIGLLCLFGLYRYYSDIEKPRVSSVQEHRVPPHGRPPGGKSFPNRDDSERGKNTAGCCRRRGERGKRGFGVSCRRSPEPECGSAN